MDWLVELAKIGAAGVSVLVLWLAYNLLSEREKAAATPIPKDMMMRPLPDTKPIYALMTLGLVCAVMLAISAVVNPPVPPEGKPDLSGLITQVRGMKAHVVNVKDTANKADGFIASYQKSPATATDSLPDARTALKSVIDESSTVVGQFDGVEIELSRVSKVVPPKR